SATPQTTRFASTFTAKAQVSIILEMPFGNWDSSITSRARLSLFTWNRCDSGSTRVLRKSLPLSQVQQLHRRYCWPTHDYSKRHRVMPLMLWPLLPVERHLARTAAIQSRSCTRGRCATLMVRSRTLQRTLNPPKMGSFPGTSALGAAKRDQAASTEMDGSFRRHLRWQKRTRG